MIEYLTDTCAVPTPSEIASYARGLAKKNARRWRSATLAAEAAAGDRLTLAAMIAEADGGDEYRAVAGAIEWLRRGMDKETARVVRCPICGGLNPGDSSHTTCM